jgi:hypothetical protein
VVPILEDFNKGNITDLVEAVPKVLGREVPRELRDLHCALGGIAAHSLHQREVRGSTTRDELGQWKRHDESSLPSR